MYSFSIICIFTSGLLFASIFNQNVNSIQLITGTTPTTVESISLNQFLGNWKQVYGAPTNFIFQGYGKCVTADYGLLDNGNISVLNSQLNLKNELEQIAGYAYYKNASEPGQLTVHLDGTPTDAPYWIVALGEIKNEQYQYTIITTPSDISLWVLVRDLVVYFHKYDQEVREFLDKYNYKYVTINQPKTCEYKIDRNYIAEGDMP